jgi:hypothetical protein
MITRLALTASLVCGLLQAAVVRLEVRERTPIADGKPFGAAGPYERLAGRVYFAVDPQLARNRIISDIGQAPRNAAGKVEFSSDFVIMRPRDAQRSNSTALVEIVNRGHETMRGWFNSATAAEPLGDGFLLEQGYTLAWVGWQWDLPEQPNRPRLFSVTATDNGRPITGLVRAEYTADKRETSFSLGDRDMWAYPALNPGDPTLVLTEREHAGTPRHTLPRAAWHFAPDARSVVVPGGLEPGHIYEIVYRAKDPVLAGLGPAAVRDFISWLKFGASGVEDRRVKTAIGFGISQSGRFLRSFVYWGFNQDESGRKVFDGLIPQVAGAGRGGFNHRFAQPSRDGRPTMNTFYPVDLFPFTDLAETDPLTGATGGLLDAARRDGVVPRIFYIYSSFEYYGRAVALIHTTPDGLRDAPMAPETRIYFFAGTQHGPAAFPPSRNATQFAENPGDFRWPVRALVEALRAWIVDGREPPPSAYPKLADHTLVPPAEVRFPKVPGVPSFPQYLQKAYRVDYGPEFAARGIVAFEPPKITGPAFPTLVPQVDADGIDLGGIRVPEVAVPLATYTGWNLRDPAAGVPDALGTYTGSWLPFARTRAERERTGDPRSSIEERYAGRAAYLERVKQAAQALAARRLLREADIPRIVEHSAAEWDYAASR